MLWLDDPVFESWQGLQIFLFSGPAMMPTQHPVQRQQEFPWNKAAGVSG
jgi:hypothetical protein